MRVRLALIVLCACSGPAAVPDAGSGGGTSLGGGSAATGGGAESLGGGSSATGGGSGSTGGGSASSGGGTSAMGGGSSVMGGGSGSTGGGTTTLTCSDLPSVTDTTTQVAIVEADLSCMQSFVTLVEHTPSTYLSAFYVLVDSTTASDALFSIVYDEARFNRFRFNAATVDDLFAHLPQAIASCPNTYRCPDWKTFIEGDLDTGRLYLCPTLTGLTEQQLRDVVPYGDYYCIESVASALAPLATQTTVTSLLTTVSTHARYWSRRNAERVTGRFAERGSPDPAAVLVLTTLASNVTLTMRGRLQTDTSDDVLADAIWILDTFFYPFQAMQPDLQSLALNTMFSSDTRFRAMAADSRLITAKTGLLPSGDVTFLVSAIASDDAYVRAEAAYTCEALSSSQFDTGIKTQLVNALQAQYAIETVLSPKVYQARALDRFNGTTLAANLKTQTEAQLLFNVGDAGTLTVRTGLDAGEVPYLLTLLQNEKVAFADIMGPQFAAPVANDPNPGMTLSVFASPQLYQDYMTAFVGYGAAAGGLYIEQLDQLFTYARTSQQSTYTLEQLVQHEFGHYLQGRYVYPGVWGDPGYFNQPRACADEGFAEVLGGLSFDAGTYFIHGRPVHTNILCAAMPFRDLNGLLSQRIGYDQAGVFDYDNGWAYTYFLFTQHKSGALGVYAAWRDGGYDLTKYGTYAGASVSQLETEWHAAMSGWCADGGPALRAPQAPSENGPVCEALPQMTLLPKPSAPPPNSRPLR